MATFQKRSTRSGKVRWRAIVRVEGTPAQSKTFGSIRAAEKWAANTEDDIRSGRADEAWEARRRTVTDACRRWRREVLRDKDRTMPKGRGAQLDWWIEHLGSATLASLTPAKLRTPVAKRECSGPTKNRYLAAISAVLEAARRDWGWMSGENPCHLVRKWEEHPGRTRWLSEEELPRVIKACGVEDDSGRLYDLAILAITTDARQGELLALQLRDLYLYGDAPYALLEARDEGAKKTKTKRMLQLVGEAIELVKRRAAARRLWAAERKHPSPESLYLFGTNRRGRPSFPAKAFKAALERAKVDDFRFHDFRHCAATYLILSAGASLRDVMDYAGHRTAQMSKRYSHLTTAHLRGLSEKMVKDRLGQVDASPDSHAE